VRRGCSNPVRFKGVSRAGVVASTWVGAMKGKTVESGDEHWDSRGQLAPLAAATKWLVRSSSRTTWGDAK